MALTVVGNVAAVTQLIEQATGLIRKIIRAVETARQNTLECERLARRVSTVHWVLSSLRDDPEMVPPLAELNNTLQEAHQLVLNCQKRSIADGFFGARRHADSFRDVNARIMFDINVLSLRLLTCTVNHTAAVPTTATVPPPASPQTHMVSSISDHYPRTFTWAEIAVATSNFAHELGRGGSPKPVVIHRNVSSSNILLDMNWTPRLSGFGAAVYQAAGEERGGQVVEEVVGTPGYIDPEYNRTKRVSTGSDVYSFGVVMLEALTGEDPATQQVDSWLLAIRNGKLEDVLDRRPSLDRRLPQMEALQIGADPALRCLSRMDRPAMSKVVANLEEALQMIRSHEPMSMARWSLIRRRTSEK
ncbi:Receptor-like protein kinase ANXUR2 [Triticum urartu]|uniref:Receptor-like protein kinase ANXUR2 n=1 Tax=Triticum urartu TaxID=4572 RepID=M7ZGL0_TRIUA|nr:Receptor-like protein kinase ANXUR2 [Triticum urartu]